MPEATPPLADINRVNPMMSAIRIVKEGLAREMNSSEISKGENPMSMLRMRYMTIVVSKSSGLVAPTSSFSLRKKNKRRNEIRIL